MYPPPFPKRMFNTYAVNIDGTPLKVVIKTDPINYPDIVEPIILTDSPICSLEKDTELTRMVIVQLLQDSCRRNKMD